LFDSLHGRRAEAAAVHQRRRDPAHFGANARERGHPFLFVAGGLADALAHNQAALHFHGGLRVEALLAIIFVADFHDPAFRVAEVGLFLGLGFRSWGRERFVSDLFAPLFFGGAFGPLRFVLGPGLR
jgi:hypothetical protein